MRVHMARVTRSAEVASCGDAPSFRWRTHRVFGGMVRVGGWLLSAISSRSVKVMKNLHEASPIQKTLLDSGLDYLPIL